MKRYKHRVIFGIASRYIDECEVENYQHPEGEWVKWEDVRRLLNITDRLDHMERFLGGRDKIEKRLSNLEKQPSANVKGILIYDPRIGGNIVSDNPALVMASFAIAGYIKTNWKFDEIFWEKISHLTNYCDILDVLKPKTRCFFNFKGPLCGYTGDEDWCDGTLERCRRLGNEKHWPIPPKKSGE